MVAVVIMLVVAVIFSQPALVLFALFALYALSGPVAAVVRWQRKRQRGREDA